MAYALEGFSILSFGRALQWIWTRATQRTMPNGSKQGVFSITLYKNMERTVLWEKFESEPELAEEEPT
jgi:hypothetical protein